MQEQQLRHQYLEMLGVSSWLSRKQLPAAATSPDWVSDYVYSGEVAVAPVQDSSVQDSSNKTGAAPNINLSSSSVAHSNAQVKSLVASLSTTNNSGEDLSRDAQLIAREVVTHLPVADFIDTQQSLDKEAEPVTAKVSLDSAQSEPPSVLKSSTTSQKSAPQMRLMFWQYPQVLIVDSLPTQTRGTLASAQYEKLLSNMLLAMRLDATRIDAGSQPYVLNWPTLAGASIDQGWDQAVSAVQYKLSKLLQDYSPKLVLMLGEHSAQMLMNVEDDFDAMRGIVFSLRAETKAITSYSLTQMLNLPGCKRDVWQDLQKVMDRGPA